MQAQRSSRAMMCALARRLRVLLVFALATYGGTIADRPIARNLVYHVRPGDEEVITFKGFSQTGGKLAITLTSLPQNGALYQLSQVFSEYGYEPKHDATPISAVPALITGSKNRAVFQRSIYGGGSIREGKYAELRYTMTSTAGETSKEGIIVITSNDVLATSTFEAGIDGWSIVSNGNSGSRPQHQRISRGRLLSFYIYGLEAVIHRQEDGDDAMRWHFVAPAKFLGNQWAAYGGSLDFVLSSAEGSFSQDNLNLNGKGHLAILECSTCNLNAGITIAMPLSKTFSYDGTTTQFSLPLNERAGWLKDPRNVILAWAKPSQCEMVNVLSALSSLKILGDFTRGHESVALDTVTIRHGQGMPRGCYT